MSGLKIPQGSKPGRIYANPQDIDRSRARSDFIDRLFPVVYHRRVR